MTEQWQELKETIIEMRDNDGIGTQKEVCKFLANLMDVLEKQMTNGWIPVNEKLPEIEQRILVTYNQEDEVKIDITYYTKHGFLLSEVIAWMPLPTPYNAESKE